MNPAVIGSAIDPPRVSPGDVVKYLVQNEPLTQVAEISRCVDKYALELEKDSSTVESLDAAIDMEIQVMNSVDELLKECREFFSAVEKRTKGAEDAISTRSQDLRGVVAKLRSTRLTTPSVSAGTANLPIAQIFMKVKEIGVAQTEVLNALEASAKELKTTLGELPNQGESMRLLARTMARLAYGSSSEPLEGDELLHAECDAHARGAHSPYDSVFGRYQRRSQEFQSGVEIIVKNSETIRNLAIGIERVTHDLDPTTKSPTSRFLTLAEELSPRQTHDTEAAVFPVPKSHWQALHWIKWLKVWASEFSIRNLFVSQLLLRPSFPVSIFLTVLFLLVNVVRVVHRVGVADAGKSTPPVATSPSIRDLLLGDKAKISDEVIRNLVPRG